MKSGNIEQFSHLSQFTSLQQFNETIAFFLQLHGDKLTKGEKIAFEQLTRYSVKYLGVCNARICKLVAACHANNGGISRSTFERMLRKAKSLGILTIHHTFREKGGLSHSVYVFQRIDRAKGKHLTAPQTSESGTPEADTAETINIHQTHRPAIDDHPIEELDHTYVPTTIPVEFVQTVKPFFNKAKEICSLWDRVKIAYRQTKSNVPIESLLPAITKAFKETVYRYKQRRIRTSFEAYYYGTVLGMLTIEQRKQYAARTNWPNWLLG